MIGTEKNLYNEMSILKSYDLIGSALKELDFDISYHAGKWYKMVEQYGYFPFEVELIDSSAQLYGVPFYVQILSDREFRLALETEEFTVSNPATGTKRTIERKFEFADAYLFGEEVVHDYFHFIVSFLNF